MSALEAVIEKLRDLPPDKQQAVLEFVIGLEEKSVPRDDPRKLMDQIRRNVERRHGVVDAVVALLREDRNR